MTLIAAFRCEEGVVICADSQETQGDWRLSVDKLIPKDVGWYRLAIGGAGCGDIIDGFTERLTDLATAWAKGLEAAEVKALIQAALIDYYDNEVRAYPFLTPDEGIMDFVCSLYCKGTGRTYLWKLAGTAVQTVSQFCVVGHGRAFYEREAQRLYRQNLPAMRGILIAIHLFSLANDTSNVIGGLTKVVFLLDTHNWPEEVRETSDRFQYPPTCWTVPEADIRVLKERVTSINEMIVNLALDCADTLIGSAEFGEMTTKLQSELTQLHKDFVYQANYQAIEAFHLGCGPLPFRNRAIEPVLTDDRLAAAGEIAKARIAKAETAEEVIARVNQQAPAKERKAE